MAAQLKVKHCTVEVLLVVASHTEEFEKLEVNCSNFDTLHFIVYLTDDM